MQNKKLFHALKAIIFLMNTTFLIGQEISKKTMTLDKSHEFSIKNSLGAFKAKQNYGTAYWSYQSFRAKLLPKVTLNLQPLTYNRSIVQRYDINNNSDVYRQQQTLNSFAQINIDQFIKETGATIYLNSTFNRLENYNNPALINYSTSPFQIGIYQPIMAYNSVKWDNKTQNLEYTQAKKRYLFEQQKLYLKATTLFFNWVLANTVVEVLSENMKNSDRLFKIGQKRYPLGTINKEDLLNLELETFTAQTELSNAIQRLSAATYEFQLFLGIDNLSSYEPILPEVITDLKIDIDQAKELAYQNNPNLLNNKIQKIKNERDYDKVLKENRFELSISASYGLNQQAENFTNSYAAFLDQQMISVNLQMPLLDWGERKGNIQRALVNKEVGKIEIEQNRDSIELNLVQMVESFNIQYKQVIVALKVREVAQESYDLTEKRFLSGKVDLLRLLASREAFSNSSESYVFALQKYWELYYKVQQLTLYDFLDERPLDADYDALIKD